MKVAVFLACLLGCTAVQSADNVPDFSEGFRRLAALGMPALDAKAQWVKSGTGMAAAYRWRGIGSTKGDAWQFVAADGKPVILSAGALQTVALGESPAKPVPQDLAKDIGTLIEGLKKLATNTGARDPFGEPYETEPMAAVLLLATQLHQTGHTGLANRLAFACFALAPEREPAVDAAIDAIASHFHDQTNEAFFASADWTAYHRGLTSLTERFPRGWANLDAVRILLPQLDKQLRAGPAPPPALPGIEIDPRALAIVAELTAAKPPAPRELPANIPPALRRRLQMMGAMGQYDGDPMPGDLWLVAAPDEERPGMPSSPLQRLAALRMAALPALAALVEDPFFTLQRRPGSRGSYYSSRESTEERAIRAYQSLARPATRGELAVRMLVSTLPDPERQLDEIEPAELRDIAIEFWQKHKDDSRERLAAAFLKEGSREQSSAAAAILAASKDPASHQLFESHALAAESPLAQIESVRTYLQTRKAAAKPFCDRYTKLVRDQMAAAGDEQEDVGEISWMVRQAGGIQKLLNEFETLVSSKSPKTLAAEIAAGKPKQALAALPTLGTLLADSPPAEQLEILLGGAVAAAHQDVRAAFLSQILWIAWHPDEEEEGEEPAAHAANPGAETPPRAIPQAEAQAWKTLLADNRTTAGRQENEYDDPGEAPDVATLAATALESTIGRRSSVQSVYSAAPVLGKTPAAVFLERATARLAGQTIPPLPDASKVSDERLAAIVAEAATKPAAGVHPYLSSLTPDERAAWRDWLAEKDDPPVPPNIAELQLVVSARAPGLIGRLKDQPGAGIVDTGFKLAPATVDQYLRQLAADIGKHSRLFVQIQTGEFPPGLAVAACIVPMPADRTKAAPEDAADGTGNAAADDQREAEQEDDGEAEAQAATITADQVFSGVAQLFEQDADADGAIVAQCYCENGNARGIWSVKDGKLLPRGESAGEDGDFLESLRSVLAEPPRERLVFRVLAISRADAGKLNQSNE